MVPNPRTLKDVSAFSHIQISVQVTEHFPNRAKKLVCNRAEMALNKNAF